ncbi:MAG: hypothetical protein EON55_28140 [Alphaproteobacteria bacterium]|nr:MAG: hypothetical protein EON55_28140 [Alphaproteobacteria bacterium]
MASSDRPRSPPTPSGIPYRPVLIESILKVTAEQALFLQVQSLLGHFESAAEYLVDVVDRKLVRQRMIEDGTWTDARGLHRSPFQVDLNDFAREQASRGFPEATRVSAHPARMDGRPGDRPGRRQVIRLHFTVEQSRYVAEQAGRGTWRVPEDYLTHLIEQQRFIHEFRECLLDGIRSGSGAPAAVVVREVSDRVRSLLTAPPRGGDAA